MRLFHLQLLALAVALLSPNAAAQDMPVSYAERPLTMPRFTIRGDAGVAYEHAEAFGSSVNIVGLAFGGGFSITDNIELDAAVAPLTLLPSPVVYANPAVGGTWRFLSLPLVEMGARLMVSIPVASDRDFGLFPSVPVLLHLGPFARLDTGVNVAVLIPVHPSQPGSLVTRSTRAGAFAYMWPAFTPDPGIPLALAINPIRFFYFGARTGVGLLSFSDVADNLYIPVGAFLGGTIAWRNRPLIDAEAHFDFPELFLPSSSAPEPGKVDTHLWTLSAIAKLYL